MGRLCPYCQRSVGTWVVILGDVGLKQGTDLTAVRVSTLGTPEFREELLCEQAGLFRRGNRGKVQEVNLLLPNMLGLGALPSHG